MPLKSNPWRPADYASLVKDVRRQAVNDHLGYVQAQQYTEDQGKALWDQEWDKVLNGTYVPASSGAVGSPSPGRSAVDLYEPKRNFLEAAEPLLAGMDFRARDSRDTWSRLRGYSDEFSNPFYREQADPWAEYLNEYIRKEPPNETKKAR